MARKMYIYRADYRVGADDRVRFFYARNAKVGKDFCRRFFSEDGVQPDHIALNKIGLMRLNVGSHDAALMDAGEEAQLTIANFGAGVKYAERDDVDGYFSPVVEGDE